MNNLTQQARIYPLQMTILGIKRGINCLKLKIINKKSKR